MSGEGWIVGRADDGIYVEEGVPFVVGGISSGEQHFSTELEALRYASMCIDDDYERVVANRKDIRARLRKAERSKTAADRRSARHAA
ncbi:hypothetical protein FHS96_004943 [Sphingomonas zeicaulis]|uniref:hypothetical protein n=1 Tax=Sphingomonas zeicaulis TaxID=1632740 RepID=UPI003D260C2A